MARIIAEVTNKARMYPGVEDVDFLARVRRDYKPLKEEHIYHTLGKTVIRASSGLDLIFYSSLNGVNGRFIEAIGSMDEILRLLISITGIYSSDGSWKHDIECDLEGERPIKPSAQKSL